MGEYFMTNDDKDLLPCPFCGATKYLKITYQDSKANASIQGDQKYWGVFCMEGCCASIDSVYPTREEAIKAWNTRSTPQQPSEPLKEKDLKDEFISIRNLLQPIPLAFRDKDHINEYLDAAANVLFKNGFRIATPQQPSKTAVQCSSCGHLDYIQQPSEPLEEKKYLDSCDAYEYVKAIVSNYSEDEARRRINSFLHRDVDCEKPQEPLKELDKKMVSEEIFNFMASMIISGRQYEHSEEFCDEFGEYLCSRFGQPSEKKALSVNFIYEVIEREYLKGIIHPENVHIPKSFESSAKIIFDALPAQREVRYPSVEDLDLITPDGKYGAQKAIDEFKKLNGG